MLTACPTNYGLPDELIYALSEGRTKEEIAFSLVANFHGDVINGGIGQAFDNHTHELEAAFSAFETVGLSPLAAFLKLARAEDTGAFKAPIGFPETDFWTDIYVSMAYNLAYSTNDRQPIDGMEGSDPKYDWVEKMLLHYAR